MKRMIPLLLSSVVLLSVAACNNAKTTSDAPNTTDNNGNVQDTTNRGTAKDDAQNQVRKNQLESDIRAREQRNQAAGDENVRADGDLESEVRSKLEANIPDGKLTVDAKNGDVTVSGTVPKQDQLAKIAPLAKQIKGVKNVAVKATLAGTSAQ